MIRIESEVWERLEQARPTGENLTARQAITDTRTRVQCALDSEGERHLLIVLHPEEGELRDTQSRGLNVVTRELVVRGQSAARYIDVQCLDASGHSAFDLIGGELAEVLPITATKPAEIVKRVLAKWRKFWGQIPQLLLTREELIGLFAEMWFLIYWLIPATGIAEAVKRWRGPYSARHDYEWGGKSVEVKATTSSRGKIHWINGSDQLAPPENGDLLFFSLHLREEAGSTNTLPALINAIRALLYTEEEVLSRFETALVLTGYSPVHDEEYLKVHLRVIEEGLYSVLDDFPRLTTLNFQEGIPPGVERIEYEINLNAFNHLCIARSATEAEVHL